MTVIERLHESEINASISSFWHNCWTVKIGDEMNGFKAESTEWSYAAAEAWLEAKAKELYPHSDFALGRRRSGPR